MRAVGGKAEVVVLVGEVVVVRFMVVVEMVVMVVLIVVKSHGCGGGYIGCTVSGLVGGRGRWCYTFRYIICTSLFPILNELVNLLLGLMVPHFIPKLSGRTIQVFTYFCRAYYKVSIFQRYCGP